MTAAIPKIIRVRTGFSFLPSFFVSPPSTKTLELCVWSTVATAVLSAASCSLLVSLFSGASNNTPDSLRYILAGNAG
eukprot:67064-Rhodomonas_salina.1